ncbi:MAG: YqgE/AlgH family protein [Alphaproteobacteria bacterium]
MAKIKNSLAGKLLIAMPSLGDPRFHRAVILICGHDDAGAMGLVINHQLPNLEFREFLSQLGITSGIKIDMKQLGVPVMGGGPVEGQRGFLLHSSDFKQPDTVNINPSLNVTGTIDALKAIVRGDGPENLLFILGYAGWGVGQLDAEMQQNSWLVADPDPDLIFNAPHSEKWIKALQKIGVDLALLSSEAGQA